MIYIIELLKFLKQFSLFVTLPLDTYDRNRCTKSKI